MTGRIETSIADGIARVVMDNPGRKNALTAAMWHALRQSCEALAGQPEVRVVVLAGRGEVFSAGADISEFHSLRRTPEQAASYSQICQAATDAILALPMPVIAEMRGPCLGAGAAIALCADLRYAADDLRFGIPAAKLGLAFENRWLPRLVETLGVAATAEILLTARAFEASAARQMEFVHAVLPAADLGGHVEKTAQGIAALAPLTLRAAKAGLRAATGEDAGAREQAEALERACAESRDYQRALDAFARKQRPEFKGD